MCRAVSVGVVSFARVTTSRALVFDVDDTDVVRINVLNVEIVGGLTEELSTITVSVVTVA